MMRGDTGCEVKQGCDVRVGKMAKKQQKKPYISQYLQDNGYINAGFGHEMADKDSQQPSNHMTLSYGL